MQVKILQELPGVQENISLKEHTTYKIGGPAKYFFVAKTKEDLIDPIKIAKELKIPVFILGGGSNLLVSDKGFAGLVIKINISDIGFKDDKVFVGAGASLNKTAGLSAENGLSGLEWAAGIPGTVGGAIYGHAQAFGTKISDSVKTVEAINLKNLEIKNFTKEQCNFSLKNSIFKNPPAGGKKWVIVSSVLKFKKDNVDQIKNRIKEFLEYRKIHHPINFPSAGSTFVNPEVVIKNKRLLDKFPELKEFNKKGVIPAGYLVAKSGLSGEKIGSAQISEKHANFIINLGGAKARDVLSLMKLAQKKVKDNFNVKLEPEVQLVGFEKNIK